MLVVDGKEYSSFRQYFLEKNPECHDPPRTEILRFVYHTVPEYHEKKRAVCRERYRLKKNGNVRNYSKFNPNFYSCTGK